MSTEITQLDLRLRSARATLEERVGLAVRAEQAAVAAQEAVREAQCDVAVAMVAAGAVPAEFRLCDAARLWRALRDREGVETSAAPAAEKKPGPGFMHIYIGLLPHWIPSRHYWAWSEEVTRVRTRERAAREGGVR